ncbi:hypothetical protein BKA69DRAFT_687232 [Paraphysoderma sedebokerense]|nr:hypothetical protein BKA69DRAFT_687232 [Paraphysoderma sedebokerense]
MLLEFLTAFFTATWLLMSTGHITELAASNVPNPYYPKSFANAPVQNSGADVIKATKNGTHVLVVDSEFNMHAFQYSETGGITHTLSSQISASISHDVGGTNWRHWRRDNTITVVMHPNVNEVMYVIKYTVSTFRLNMYTMNTSAPFSEIDQDSYQYSTTQMAYFSQPFLYPRLVANISFNYLYIGAFNDGSQDTANNVSGFWLSMHSIYNPLNPNIFRNISSTTKRIFSMDFFCNDAPVVCLWTSPTTIEEYFLEDLSFRRTYTVASPPIKFDPSIAKDATTYSSYFFHRNSTNATEYVLQKRNRTDVMAVALLPYQVYFAYDIPNIQLAPDGLAVAVTANSSVSSIGLGGTEILICQYDSSLDLKATTVLSTVRQDNMTGFFVLDNGGFIVVGSTSGDLNSPTSTSAPQNRVFAIQFEPLVVNAVISAKTMLLMDNEAIEIRFNTTPASLTSIIPTVTFGSRNCSNVHWNSSSLFVQIPAGVGGQST